MSDSEIKNTTFEKKLQNIPLARQQPLRKMTIFIKPAIPQSEDVFKLSTIDQIMPRKHMAFLFCFELAESDKLNAIKQLQSGLESALADMPQFAGEMQLADNKRNELQLFLGPDSAVFFEENHTWSGKSFTELKAAHFPISLLPEDELLSEAAKTDNGLQVMMIKATFIPGGLILAVQVHHSFTDAKGAEMFLKAWSKHASAHFQCRKLDVEPLDEEALERWRLSYGSKKVKAEDFPEFKDALYQVSGTKSEVVPSLWSMSKEKLEELQVFVSSPTPVSKTEALAAFLACHLYRARFGSDTDSNRQINDITLYAASDLRSRIEPPLAPSFIGNASMIVPVLTTLDQLINVSGPSLNSIASQIHEAVAKYDTTAVKKRISFYNGQPSIGAKRPNLNYYPGPNTLITDTSEICYYSLDWGGSLGQIDCFRTVGMSASTGNCSVYPKLRDGSIEIFLRHEKEVVDALAISEDFSRFVKPVS